MHLSQISDTNILKILLFCSKSHNIGIITLSLFTTSFWLLKKILNSQQKKRKIFLMNFFFQFWVFLQLLLKVLKAKKVNKRYHQWWFQALNFLQNKSFLNLLFHQVSLNLLLLKLETFGALWVCNLILNLWQRVWSS